MGTFYVKWDAAGAGNGTSWTDAYTTIQAAITANHAAGDIIEVSGGPSGHTYSEALSTAGATTVLQGSTAAGHSGMVTVSSGASNAMGLLHNGTTINNLTLTTTTGTGIALRTYTGTVLNDVVLNGGTIPFSFGVGGSATFNRVKIINHTDATNGGGVIANGTFTSNNCWWENNKSPLTISGGTGHVINNPLFIGHKEAAVNVTGGDTVINNPIEVACPYGNNTINPFTRSGGTLAINYGDLLGNIFAPTTYGPASAGVTVDANTVNLSPRFTSPRRNGYITLCIDDVGNWDDFKTLCDWANPLGIYLVFSAQGARTISAGTYTEMATYITAGNDVACHSEDHPGSLIVLTAVSITGKSGSTPTVDIAMTQTDPSSANWTGSVVLKEGGSAVKTINCTIATTMGALVTAIKAQSGWDATLNANGVNAIPAVCLADATGTSVAGATNFSYDQDEYWYYEVAEPKAILETGINANLVSTLTADDGVTVLTADDGVTPLTGTGTFSIKMFTPPSNAVNSTLIGWLTTAANFTDAGTDPFTIGRGAAQGSYTLSDDIQDDYTGSLGLKIMNVLSVDLATEFNTSVASKVYALCEGLQWMGAYMMVYDHSFAAGYTLANWKLFIQTLMTYPQISIKTPSQMATIIRSTGGYTDLDSDGLRWSKTFTDAQNYHLTYATPSQIRIGGTNAGLTTDKDSLAVPWMGGYPMGPYRSPTMGGGGLGLGLGLSGNYPHRRR